jgi:hypothetical protein
VEPLVGSFVFVGLLGATLGLFWIEVRDAHDGATARR